MDALPVRKTPWLTLSLGLHTGLALLLGCFWIIQASGEDTVCILKPRCRTGPVPQMFALPKADDHPPIVPKVFQADPTIINDADEVVVNSTPTNLNASSVSGDSHDLVSTEPFRRKVTYGMIGLSGGGGGRYGGFRACFG